MFAKRSYEKEIIDLGEPHYTPQEYEDCLEKLGLVGVLLFGDRATKKAFKQTSSFNSVLEVGCGGGFTAKLLTKWFPGCRVTGIDMSEKAIEFAKKRHNEAALSNLDFKYVKQKGVKEPDNSYDIVTATLVTHHMDDDELVAFFKEAKRVARKEVIINDLHRHIIAYGFYFLMAPLLFRNRLISKDGLLSIKRSFRKKELEKYLQQAGIAEKDYKITWYFPFRYIVRITC